MTVNPALAIQKIYIRSLSCEVPAYHLLPKAVHQPKIDIEIDTGAGAVIEGMHEATLSLTVRATQNGKHLFLVVLKQGGLFTLSGVRSSDVETVLKQSCAAILYPYARKNVAVAILNGGFQPVILNHIPFDSAFKSRFGSDPDQPSQPEPVPEAAAVEHADPAPAVSPPPEDAVAAPPAISLPPPISVSPRRPRPNWAYALFLVALIPPLAYWALQPPASPPAPPPVAPAPPVDQAKVAVDKLASAGTAWLAGQEGYVVLTRPLASADGVMDMEKLRVAAPLHVIREKSGTGYAVIAGSYPSQAEADRATQELAAQGLAVEVRTVAEIRD